MPSLSSNKGKKKIPANLAPIGEVCVPVRVPADPEWIAMFLGAIHSLTLQIRYDRDADHNARVVAARWRDVYAQVENSVFNTEGCGGELMPQTLLRQSTENPCVLEYSLDEGLTWIPFANTSKCMPRIRRVRDGSYVWEGFDAPTFYRFPDSDYYPPSLYPDFHDPVPVDGATTNDKRCNAAYSAAKALEWWYHNIVDLISEYSSDMLIDMARDLLSAIANLHGVDWLLDLAATIGLDLLNSVDEFIVSAFTSETLIDVQNFLYCNATVAPDGVVTFDYDAVWTEWGSAVSAPYNGLFRILNQIWGERGLNSAGAMKLGAGDCSSASCVPDCATSVLFAQYRPNPLTPGFTHGGVVQCYPSGGCFLTPPLRYTFTQTEWVKHFNVEFFGFANWTGTIHCSNGYEQPFSNHHSNGQIYNQDHVFAVPQQCDWIELRLSTYPQIGVRWASFYRCE
jgi:hypothetical protein